jgi:hypothetical protein
MPEFRVFGYFEGEHDCEPPEPDKRWWTVGMEADHEFAVFVQRKRDGEWQEQDTSEVYERALLVKNALNEYWKEEIAAEKTDPLLPCDTVSFTLTNEHGDHIETITVDLRDESVDSDAPEQYLNEIDVFRAGEYVTSYAPDHIDPDDWDVIERAAKLANVYVPALETKDPTTS